MMSLEELRHTGLLAMGNDSIPFFDPLVYPHKKKKKLHIYTNFVIALHSHYIENY